MRNKKKFREMKKISQYVHLAKQNEIRMFIYSAVWSQCRAMQDSFIMLV